MGGDTTFQVITTDGLEGTIEKKWLAESAGGSDVPVRLQNGSTIMVPAEKLERRGADIYLLKLNLREMLDGSDRGSSEIRDNERGEKIIIPVVVEEAVVEKDIVETGRVRITRTIHEREEIIEEPLLREEIEVRRVPVHQVVEGRPKPRTEGNVLIVPILEEVLVVEKRLMLKEELHIIHHRHREMTHQQITLRTQEPIIERFDGDGKPVRGNDTTT